MLAKKSKEKAEQESILKDALRVSSGLAFIYGYCICQKNWSLRLDFYLYHKEYGTYMLCLKFNLV